MKKVVSNLDLRKGIVQAINILCDAVSSTLGPSGNNVLINNDEIAPYITNDGVTIAKSIESEDALINTILEIAKEASLKTNEEVGDGTTTTLVLLQAILCEGFKEIDAGSNPIILKKELNVCLNNIIDSLQRIKRKPTKNDLISIASISSNDKDIGKFIFSVYSKMRGKYGIKLEESSSDKTYYEIKKGYSLLIDNISNLYFQDKNEISLNDVHILILRGYLESLEQISDIINEAVERNKNIVIFASSYNEVLNDELLVYFMQANKNIYLFKLPDFGMHKEQIEEDVSTLSDANIKNINYEDVFWNDLGFVKSIIIKKDEVILINNNEKIFKRIKKLKKVLQETTETYEKDFLSERIAKLDKGTATIYVGGITKTEVKEKLMRYEDALCALDVASFGIIPGEGLALLKIGEELSTNNAGEKIMKKVLLMPFKKIMLNSGEDWAFRWKQIKDNNYQKVYNFITNNLEDVNKSQIIDPVKVTIEALKNATSIAGMLLTTNFLIINEKIKFDNSEF